MKSKRSAKRGIKKKASQKFGDEIIMYAIPVISSPSGIKGHN